MKPRTRSSVARRPGPSAWVVLGAAVLGCAAPKGGDPFAAYRDAPGFDAAREACIDLAVERTANFDGQSTASKAAIGMFLDCMAGKGFAPGSGDR